mmetsp:Transcript_43388/g.74021  ORF Transcript_43388/g.74021 Transcript_43388/m.74021 type:complete len:213 (+) Transcript_43388:979-1617(+)
MALYNSSCDLAYDTAPYPPPPSFGKASRSDRAAFQRSSEAGEDDEDDDDDAWCDNTPASQSIRAFHAAISPRDAGIAAGTSSAPPPLDVDDAPFFFFFVFFADDDDDPPSSLLFPSPPMCDDTPRLARNVSNTSLHPLTLLVRARSTARLKSAVRIWFGVAPTRGTAEEDEDVPPPFLLPLPPLPPELPLPPPPEFSEDDEDDTTGTRFKTS